MKRLRRHRLFLGVLLPVLFTVGLFCPCSQAMAAARSRQDQDPHARCHERGSNQNSSTPAPGNHPSDCPHCDHLQVAKSESFSLPTTPLTSVTAVLPAFPLGVSPTPAALYFCYQAFSGLSPPRSVLRQKCILVI